MMGISTFYFDQMIFLVLSQCDEININDGNTSTMRQSYHSREKKNKCLLKDQNCHVVLVDSF